MARSSLRLIRSIKEFCTIEERKNLPRKLRGIYVLYNKRKKGKKKNKFEVVYVGKSEKDMRSRLWEHTRSKYLKGQWDHFSVFEVHENISHEEISELEGLILFIYRKDPGTNRMNALRGSKKFFTVKKVSLSGERREAF